MSAAAILGRRGRAAAPSRSWSRVGRARRPIRAAAIPLTARRHVRRGTRKTRAVIWANAVCPRTRFRLALQWTHRRRGSRRMFERMIYKAITFDDVLLEPA